MTGWRTTPRRADDNTLMTRRAHLEGRPRRSPRRQLRVTMRTAPVQTRNAHPQPHLSPERPTQVRRAAPPPIHLAAIKPWRARGRSTAGSAVNTPGTRSHGVAVGHQRGSELLAHPGNATGNYVRSRILASSPKLAGLTSRCTTPDSCAGRSMLRRLAPRSKRPGRLLSRPLGR
jgi:hypothetical protein